MAKSGTVDYQQLVGQLSAITAGEDDALANSSNFVALLYDAIPNINWLGLYVLRVDELVLGPFQGKPACVRIPLGRGVCGTAAETRQTLRVKDVRTFDGHIACDAASRSEIVIPLIVDGNLVGVLDVDSPDVERFDETDEQGLALLCNTFSAALAKCQPGAPGFI